MKYLLLYNPVSGKGRFNKKISYITEEFKKRNLHLDIYKSKEEKDLTKKALEDGSKYDFVIVSGGDGTVNEVLNGIMPLEKRPTLAIIPSGTANDTAAILGMKKRVKKSLELIFNEKPIAMDINKLNDHYFIYTTAAGILTKISYDIKREDLKKYGYLAYLAEGMKDIIKDYNMEIEVIHDGGIVRGKFMLILALSARRVAGFNLRRFSNAKLNDGILELRLIHYQKRTKLYRLITFFLFRGRKYKNDVHLRSSHYQISAVKDVIWNIDGEKGDVGNANITVLKQSLNVIASPKSKKSFF